MTFDVEVVVRHSGEVLQETLYHDGPAPPAWSDADVRAVVTAMLLAVDRGAGGGQNHAQSVSLRGVSWIVTPFEAGAAIAIEIPSGSVIGGPFEIAPEQLSEAIRRLAAADVRP